MYLLNVINPYSTNYEQYILRADSEKEAKFKFNTEYPSYKICQVLDVTNEIIDVASLMYED